MPSAPFTNRTLSLSTISPIEIAPPPSREVRLCDCYQDYNNLYA